MCEHALLPSRRRWGGSAPLCKLGKRHCEESRVVGCCHPERLLTCSCSFLEFFCTEVERMNQHCAPRVTSCILYWCSGIILCRSQKRRWSRASESILCPSHSSACENFHKISVTPLTLKVFYPVIFLCWRLQPALYPSSPLGPQGPNSARAHRTISQDSSAIFARHRLTECEWALSLHF